MIIYFVADFQLQSGTSTQSGQSTILRLSLNAKSNTVL